MKQGQAETHLDAPDAQDAGGQDQPQPPCGEFLFGMPFWAGPGTHVATTAAVATPRPSANRREGSQRA